MPGLLANPCNTLENSLIYFLTSSLLVCKFFYILFVIEVIVSFISFGLASDYSP